LKTEELWIQVKVYGDRAARDELIVQYMGYAEALAATAFRKDNHGFTYDEILSNAYLGLIDAVERYTGVNDATFLTYARTRIRGAIIDGFRKEGVIPMNLVRWGKRMAEQSSEDLSKTYHVSEQQLRIIRNVVDGFSIEYVGDDSSRLDTCFVDMYDNVLLQVDIANAMQLLSSKERFLLYLYYYQSIPQSRIAKYYECTEANISGLKTRALRKLRRYFNE